MSDTCPVVKIKTPSGWAHLDESTFDPARHELWVDPLDHDGDEHKGGAKQPANDPNDLSTMTNKALVGLAAERGVDLGDATKKDDLIAALELHAEQNLAQE